jgi:hypothetical protein
MKISQAIRSDPKVISLVSSISLRGRRYFTADGVQVNLRDEIERLGYSCKSNSLSNIIARMQGRYVPKTPTRPFAARATANRYVKTFRALNELWRGIPIILHPFSFLFLRQALRRSGE